LCVWGGGYVCEGTRGEGGGRGLGEQVEVAGLGGQEREET
jgi:hypothetical protein